MAFLKSLRPDAVPPNIFKRYPEIYQPWSQMSEALMNGASTLSQGQREVILAYAAGVCGCEFVCIAHSEVAYAWGVPTGTVEWLLEDPNTPKVDAPFRVLLGYVRKLALTPHQINQADVDKVVDAGWDDHAIHHAIAVTGRAALMQRLVQGLGLAPLDRKEYAMHAKRRVQLGYAEVFGK